MKKLRSAPQPIPLNSKPLPARVKILDGAVTLYKRPGSSSWWACFYNHQVPIRTTTRTDDIEAAKNTARQWYFEKQLQIAGGIAPTTKVKSFEYAAELAMSEYDSEAARGIRSAKYVAGMRRVLRQLNPIIGNIAADAIDQQTWNKTKAEVISRNPKISNRTLHQYKNVIMVVTKQAVIRGDMKAQPAFMRESSGSADDTPRTWFPVDEFQLLKKALKANIEQHKKDKTRWINQAEELFDYVMFVVNVGMRTGEAMNVRFCDVTFAQENKKEYLEIRNIKGKRGNFGEAKSFYAAPFAMRHLIARAGLKMENYKQSEAKIFNHYHRDAFRAVLEKAGLRYTKDRTPRKRDLVSLRHTYICYRLLAGADVWSVAKNCRTSEFMISNHYAKYLSVLDNRGINKSAYDEATEAQ